MSNEPLNPYAAPIAGGVPEPKRLGIPNAKNPTILARWSVGLLLLGAAVDLVFHVLETIAGSPELENLSLFVSLPLYLAYLVVFLCWSYRVLWNASLVSPSQMTVSPGWGVGAYFVPIANFWIPVKALLQASRVCGTSAGIVLIWWFGGFVVAAIYLPYAIWYSDDLLNGPTLAEHALVVSDLFFAVLETVIVFGLTRVQSNWTGEQEPGDGEP